VKTVWQFLKDLNIRVIMWHSNSTPTYIPKRTENVCPQILSYTQVSSTTHNSQKVEWTQCPSTDEWTKYGEVHSYNRISSCSKKKKEWSTNTYYDMMNTEKTILSKRSQTQKIVCSHLCTILRINTCIETEGRLGFTTQRRMVSDC
jgi:hypothetical protein